MTEQPQSYHPLCRTQEMIETDQNVSTVRSRQHLATAFLLIKSPDIPLAAAGLPVVSSSASTRNSCAALLLRKFQGFQYFSSTSRTSIISVICFSVFSSQKAKPIRCTGLKLQDYTAEVGLKHSLVIGNLPALLWILCLSMQSFQDQIRLENPAAM